MRQTTSSSDHRDGQLVDPNNRRIHKLRVQLMDACNFRCFYCIPPGAQFSHSSELLSSREIIHICSNLCDFGINEIRVSGGEPTLRKDFDEIIKGLSDLDLQRLGVTTNALSLKEKLPFLKNTKCQHINISLDSLDKRTFQLITGVDAVDEVCGSAIMARQMGFYVKVNVVLLRGINDNEIFNFIKFSSQNDIEVRFLELMKIGPFRDRHADFFISAEEGIKRIEEREVLAPLSVNCDSTSFNFQTSSGGKIGFIASETKSFCGSCSRWRLTAKGKLRACIMSENGVDLRGVSVDQYPDIVNDVLKMKPALRYDHIDQPMYQIGG